MERERERETENRMYKNFALCSAGFAKLFYTHFCLALLDSACQCVSPPKEILF